MAHNPTADARVLLTGAGSRWMSRGSTLVAANVDGPGGQAEWLIQDGAIAVIELDLVVDAQGAIRVREATLAADTLILRTGATLETAGARLALRQVDGDLHLADSVLTLACSPGTLEINGGARSGGRHPPHSTARPRARPVRRLPSQRPCHTGRPAGSALR